VEENRSNTHDLSEQMLLTLFEDNDATVSLATWKWSSDSPGREHAAAERDDR